MALIDNPKEWILLLFKKEASGSDQQDCQIFQEGKAFTTLPMVTGERVFGVYKSKYYFSPLALYIVDNKGSRRIRWKSIVKCTSFHGCGKSKSRLTLSDGSVEIIELSDLATGYSGRIGQLYHQMIDRHGSIDVSKYTPVPEHLASISKMRLLRSASTFPPIWHGDILCSCGEKDKLQILFEGDLTTERNICDTDNNPLQSWMKCGNCDEEFELFDPTKHGYDASIGEIALRSPDNGSSKQTFSCICSGQEFRISASAVFDFEGVEELNQNIPSNEFGWFSVNAICQACGQKFTPIDYETA